MQSTVRRSAALPRRPHSRRERGQSLVEFALILPVFFLLLAGTLDLGRVAYAQISVTNAAREGALEAAAEANPGPIKFVAGQPCDQSTNTVMCRTILESKDSFVTIQPSDVQLSCNPRCSTGIGNMVTVSVTGHLRLVTPVLSGFFGGNSDISFAGSSTAQIETLPQPGPVPTPAPTATAAPTPSPTPTATPTPLQCPTPSAGFTYTISPSNHKAPVTITVTDTSTPTAQQSPNCEVYKWTWDWGDGTTPGGVQGPLSHAYINPGTYQVTLTVNAPSSSSTSGAVTVDVNKP